MIKFLQEKFGAQKIDKIYYFSNRAGSQCEHCFNLLNLLHHQKDLHIEEEWCFSPPHTAKELKMRSVSVLNDVHTEQICNSKNVTTREKLFE